MKIGIIGGGYSGMTIAKELVEKGFDVTIFEKESYVGGMVFTTKICGNNLEKYYRHIFKSDREVIELTREMGLENELIWPATKMGYLINRKADFFGTPISLIKFKGLSLIEKIIFGFNIINIKLINNYKKLEKVTAEEWLLKRVGKNIYAKIWEPLLISKFGEMKSKVSMAWLWGKIKLRSTSASNKGENLGYIKGSYQLLTDKLYEYLMSKNVTIKFESNIEKVIKGDNQYTIVNNNEYEKFDVVVSTLNYQSSIRIFDDLLTDEEKEKMNKVKYTAARTMLLVTDKSLTPFYWLNIGDNDIPFGGIIEHTNFIDKSNYQNNHIIYISNYMTQENELYKKTPDELLKIYMKYLSQINNTFSMENVKEFYVFDEKYAQPIIECNYSDIIMENKLENENIYLCTMPQIYPEDRGMNYAIKMGKKVSQLIISNTEKENV